MPKRFAHNDLFLSDNAAILLGIVWQIGREVVESYLQSLYQIVCQKLIKKPSLIKQQATQSILTQCLKTG